MSDNDIQAIQSDLEAIKKEIGEEPSKVDGSKGSGIKGILVEILDRVDKMDQKLENLSKTPPITSLAGIKKAGSWMAIVGLVLMSAFQQCSSSVNLSKPAQAAVEKAIQ